MPSDLWRIRRDSRKASSFKLERAIVPSDWTRLLVNARRVHELTISPFSVEDYRVFMFGVGAQILLPNIRMLDWSVVESDEVAFMCIPAFLGPRLQRITLSLDTISLPLQHTFLAQLSVRYPCVTHVTISAGSTVEHLEALSTAVCYWNQLRVLQVGRLNNNALLHLGTAPRLSSLRLTDLFRAPVFDFVAADHPPMFQALQELSITATDISSCIDIVKVLSKSPLQKYDACYARTSSVKWGALCNALSRHCDHSSLLEVDLGAAHNDVEDRFELHDCQVGGRQLKPLLVFFNLTSVSLDPSASLDVDDGMVMAMAKAWPHLQKFSLGEVNCINYSPDHTKVTLQGLIPFAQFCPKLSSLCMPVDTRDVEAEEVKARQVIHTQALYHLDVLTSPIRSPGKVAAFLSDVFPEFCMVNNYGRRQIISRGDPRTEVDIMWSQVMDLLPIFASVRRKERAYSTIND